MSLMKSTLAELRNEYTKKGLDVADVSTDPLRQFRIWLDDALAANVPEANAMHLSTVSADGRPSGRIVLLKGLDDRGFVFFTNYLSRKGKEMEAHPFGALTFFWSELERQVRIEGRVEKVSASESDEYFQSRPRGSQIGALVSDQSSEIENREVLENKRIQLEKKYENTLIPRPDHWGGYRIVPHFLEFWQGRPSRLHDRIAYQQNGSQWLISRLSP
jgi:pyridoxamine 5'-phosphate oxidase